MFRGISCATHMVDSNYSGGFSLIYLGKAHFAIDIQHAVRLWNPTCIALDS